MSTPILHIAGPMTRDGQDCARCGIVLSSTRILPESICVQPDGHYASTRGAAPEESRTGTLCTARPDAPSIRVIGAFPNPNSDKLL